MIGAILRGVRGEVNRLLDFVRSDAIATTRYSWIVGIGHRAVKPRAINNFDGPDRIDNHLQWPEAPPRPM